MDLLNVIIRPIHSEKSYALRAGDVKKYVFEVNKKANKYEISLCFKMIYGFEPEKVNVINRKPTAVRTGTRKPGMSKAKRLAYITLPKGMDISFEAEETNEEKSK